LQVYQAAPKYRPVTIVLETKDDLDQVVMIMQTVADNRVVHLPQLSKAAKTILSMIHSEIGET
jgi:hypothetical protein